MSNDAKAAEYAEKMVDLEKETFIKITQISTTYGVEPLQAIILFADQLITTAKNVFEEMKKEHEKKKKGATNE